MCSVHSFSPTSRTCSFWAGDWFPRKNLEEPACLRRAPRGSSGPLSCVASAQHGKTFSLHAACQLFTSIYPFLCPKRGTSPHPHPLVAAVCTRVRRWEQHRQTYTFTHRHTHSHTDTHIDTQTNTNKRGVPSTLCYTGQGAVWRESRLMQFTCQAGTELDTGAK